MVIMNKTIPTLKINIVSKEEYKKYIQCNDFIKKWDNFSKLSNHCMITQEYEFISSWYQFYTSLYDPLLILGYYDNELVGILPLALSKKDNSLCHAGAYSSAYHGWLCFKEYESEFLLQSLITIKQNLAIKKWHWLYIPPDVNTDWLKDNRLKNHGIFVEIIESVSPIYQLADQTRIDKVRKSRSLRPLINRLKREGELRIEKIVDRKRADALFDVMANQSNFRKLALYNYLPFKYDPLRKDWYLSRLENNDNIQFVILWQGDKLLACSLAYCSKERVIGIMSSYDPVQSASSPGTVFFILYIDYLREKGYQYLDFTPGGESYKERFCNDYKRVIKPTFTFDYQSRIKQESKLILKKYYNSLLKVKKIDQTFKNIKNLKHKSIKTLCKNKIKANIEGKGQLFLYKNPHFYTQQAGLYCVNQQHYPDLFLYKDIERCYLPKQMASDALRSFSRRDSLYSIVSDGELQLFAWLAIAGKKHWETCVYECLAESKNNYVIYDLYINPNCKDIEKVFSSFIDTVTQQFRQDKNKKLYLLKPLGMEIYLPIKHGFSLEIKTA